MKIGIVKEIKPSEYRVAATPAAVVEMTRKGHEVYVEHDAGVGSGFTDERKKTERCLNCKRGGKSLDNRRPDL